MIIKLQSQNILGNLKQKLHVFEPDQALADTSQPTSKRFTEEQKRNLVLEGQTTDIAVEDLCQREGITAKTFQAWTNKFLRSKEATVVEAPTKSNQEKRFRIVLEGKTGLTSIAEICRRERIDQDTFLAWTKEFVEVRNASLLEFKSRSRIYQRNRELFKTAANLEVFEYLDNYVDFTDKESLTILRSDSKRLNRQKDIANVVCLEKVNDIRYINKFFEEVNSKLPMGGLFAGTLETFQARRQRKNINRIPVINELYFAAEFVAKRIIPKLSWTKKYYFDITKGNDRLLSKAEGLGRLVSCGFRIMDYKSVDGLLYFVVKKVKEPEFNMSPSYGPLYKMPRLGKNGKIIGVYKFRTMHPYSEYLQDYIVRAHGYAETGKPADDFRIPAWGKFMRRFWLDEVPQLINVLKGEMKLVGIRPVSQRYFEDIPKEMQKLRLTQKPGCVPPYVALNRDGNVMSVLRSEKDYLEEKIKNPYTTDTKFFFKAIFNIVVNHKRSA